MSCFCLDTVDAMSASEVLVRERLAASISTSSNAIDNMLGGGVPIRKITEFCGAPGIGKTQFGYNLSESFLCSLFLF